MLLINQDYKEELTYLLMEKILSSGVKKYKTRLIEKLKALMKKKRINVGALASANHFNIIKTPLSFKWVKFTINKNHQFDLFRGFKILVI